MMGRTHAGTGILLWSLTTPFCPSGREVLLGAGVAAVAALGPDIDHPSSKVSRVLLGPLRTIVGPMIARACGGHRALTHTVWMVGFVTLLAGVLTAPEWMAAAVGIGWAAHIAGDCLTVEGVPVLWPVRFRIRGPLRTGGVGELIFMSLQTLAIAGVVYQGVFS